MTSPTCPACPVAPRSTAPSRPRIVDCRAELVRGGPAWHCSAVRSTSPPPARRTSTPPRSAAPSPARCWCSAMKDDGVDIWGDGSTYKGNDIERFYRYGLLVNPALRIYKPWLDQSTLSPSLAAAAEMSEFLTERETCRTGPARRRRTRPTPTSGAPPTRPSCSRSSGTGSMDIVEPIMGVAHYRDDVAIATEDRHPASSTRAGRSPSTARSSPSSGGAGDEGQRRSAVATGLA
jgi:argininosuccinate synthase